MGSMIFMIVWFQNAVQESTDPELNLDTYCRRSSCEKAKSAVLRSSPYSAPSTVS